MGEFEMKKKMLIFIMMTLLVVTGMCNAALAKEAGGERVAILLMGSNDFKTDQYFSMLGKYFLDNNPHHNRIVIGSDIQSKYQEYWLDKGFLEEQKPEKEDLIALVSYLDVDKVLFLMVKDPVVEKTYTMDWFESGERSRASIQVNAFLASREKVLKLKAANHEDDSFASDLRAKRGAFKKCVVEISKDMLPLM